MQEFDHQQNDGACEALFRQVICWKKLFKFVVLRWLDTRAGPGSSGLGFRVVKLRVKP